MNLVLYHVLKALVVGGTEEDLCVHLAAGVTAVENFVAALLVTVVVQEAGDLLHVHGVVERRGVADFSFVGRHLDELK